MCYIGSELWEITFDGLLSLVKKSNSSVSMECREL